jgi:hypothetical protein
MLASTESLIAEMNRLHDYVTRVLERGEAARDDRLVLYGVAQGRGNVEALAKIGPAGELKQHIAALEQKGPAYGDDGSADEDADETDRPPGAEDVWLWQSSAANQPRAR